MKHHLVYKTTQISTGRIYIGKHSTNKLEDGYKGSGTEIAPLLKETPDDFVREVLFDFPSAEEAFEKEAELVTPEFLEGKGTTVFNKVPGGNLSPAAIKLWSAWQPGETHPPITYAATTRADCSIIKLYKRSCRSESTQHRMSVKGFKQYYTAPTFSQLIKILKTADKTAHEYARKAYNKAKGTHFFLAVNQRTKETYAQYVFVALHDFKTAEVYWKESNVKRQETFKLIPTDNDIFEINLSSVVKPKVNQTETDIISELRQQINELKTIIALQKQSIENMQEIVDMNPVLCEMLERLHEENIQLKGL